MLNEKGFQDEVNAYVNVVIKNLPASQRCIKQNQEIPGGRCCLKTSLKILLWWMARYKEHTK